MSSLASSVLWSTPTSLHPSPPTRLPLAAGNLVVGIVRSDKMPPRRLAPCQPGPDLRCASRGFARERWRDLPSSWTALVHVPCSLTPAGPRARPFGPSVSPSVVLRTSAPTTILFRGSIARPTHHLCTLRYVGRPTHRNTRIRAVVNLLGRGSHPRGCFEVFAVSTSTSSSQA